MIGEVTEETEGEADQEIIAEAPVDRDLHLTGETSTMNVKVRETAKAAIWSGKIEKVSTLTAIVTMA